MRIDDTAPIVSDDAPLPWVNGPVSVSLSATDTASGVDTLVYSVDGSEPSESYTGPVGVSAEGTTTIRYRATDAVGNLLVLLGVAFVRMASRRRNASNV